MNRNWVIIAIIVLACAGFLAWLFIASSQPLPGQKIDDLGRGHVQIGAEVTYNSNPPTSGKHYEDWVRAGVYESSRDDRNLVHSLEHGYIIMHYKCDLPSVIASEAKQSTSSSEIASSPSTNAQGPRNDDNEQCEERKNQLTKIYENKGKNKLIVMPRPNLDTNFALTAWQYIDKFDPSTSSGLSVSEIGRIEKFIDAHLNQGPEKTME